MSVHSTSSVRTSMVRSSGAPLASCLGEPAAAEIRPLPPRQVAAPTAAGAWSRWRWKRPRRRDARPRLGRSPQGRPQARHWLRSLYPRLVYQNLVCPKLVCPRLGLTNLSGRKIEPIGQFLVDLFDRLAPGLKANEIIHEPGHQEPAPEINKGCRNLGQRHVGFEVVVGAHDQSEPQWPDDLADAAKAIGRSHAGGSKMGRPDLGRIGPDDGKAAIGEEEGHRQ